MSESAAKYCRSAAIVCGSATTVCGSTVNPLLEHVDLLLQFADPLLRFADLLLLTGLCACIFCKLGSSRTIARLHKIAVGASAFNVPKQLVHGAVGKVSNNKKPDFLFRVFCVFVQCNRSTNGKTETKIRF